MVKSGAFSVKLKTKGPFTKICQLRWLLNRDGQLMPKE
jgi:hypothetical protein